MAKTYLVYSLPNVIYYSIDSHKATAKGMWDQLAKIMQGSREGNQMKITNSLTWYKAFKSKKGESLTDTYERFCTILNDLHKNRIVKSNLKCNIKFLNNLQPEWKGFVVHIRHNRSLETVLLHEIYEMLLQDEDDVTELMGVSKSKEKVKEDLVALVSHTKKGQSSHHYHKEEMHQSESDYAYDPESDSDPEIDSIKKALTLLTREFGNKKSVKKPSNKHRDYKISLKASESLKMGARRRRRDELKTHLMINLRRMQ